MDLRARGTLSDDIVFRVRAPFASLWRAEAFDTYDGSTWTRSTSPLIPAGFERQRRLRRARPDRVGGGRDARSCRPSSSSSRSRTCCSRPATPRTVYFPAGGLRSDRDGSISSPIFLDQGLVYSVESTIPTATPAQLRSLGPMSRDARATSRHQRLLQLPETLAAAGPRPRRPDHGGRAERVRRGDGRAGVAPDEHAVRPDRAAGAGGRRRGGSLPVRHAPRILRAHRRGDGGAAAGRGHPDAGRHGLRPRGAQPVHRATTRCATRTRTRGSRSTTRGYGWVPYDPTFGVPAAPDAWGSPVGADLMAWVADRAARVVPAGVRSAVGGARAPSVTRRARRRGRVAGGAPPGCASAGWSVLAGDGARGEPRHPTRSPRPTRTCCSRLAAAGHAPDPSKTPSEVRAEVLADGPAGRRGGGAREPGRRHRSSGRGSHARVDRPGDDRRHARASPPRRACGSSRATDSRSAR